MLEKVEHDLSQSAKAFRELVWPIIQPWVGDGKFLQMEDIKTSEVARQMDLLAGIDGWQIHVDGMKGIASRVQIGKAYNTFTIRMSRDSGAKTEFEKRLTAIQSQGKFIYPFLSVQAYLQNWTGPVLSVGMAKTKDIIEFIQRNLHETRRTTNASFAYCTWEKMLNYGYIIKFYDASWMG